MRRTSNVSVRGRGVVRHGAAASLMTALAVLGSLAMAPGDQTKPAPKPAAPEAKPAAAGLAAFKDEIKGTTLSIEMVPVTPKDAAAGVKPFYIAKVETTWDLYDVFLFGFDQKEPNGSTPEADAITRPSKPYISMDRGFGHAGFPAISISYYGAKKYCEWLSIKTGRTYRLPTVAEWQLACGQGAVAKDKVAEFAWCKENAEGKTHAVGTAKADALGLFDMGGNASEWCTDAEGKGVTLGGTFRDAADAVGCGSVVPYSSDWNASDPQFPKSKWWLADGGFVGFRVVCESK